MLNPNDRPLIYTLMGNMPVDELNFRCEWQERHDATVFVEEYWVPGLCLKRSVNVRLKKGALAGGYQAKLGG